MSGDYPFADQGRRLRLLCQAEGMHSSAALAARLGWPGSSGISKFETGARRVPLDKALQLAAKIPGFDPIWLWEGDKRGLSFDLRNRIEDEEAKEQAQGIPPDDLRGPDNPLPSRFNGGSRSEEVRIAPSRLNGGSRSGEIGIEELRERCRIYERALRMIMTKLPNSPAAKTAKHALQLGEFDPSTE
jgi:transcriptional regulator with XRE-family HTH domain